MFCTSACQGPYTRAAAGVFVSGLNFWLERLNFQLEKKVFPSVRWVSIWSVVAFSPVKDNYAMLLEAGEMLSEVSALITAGCKCVLRPNQEAAVTVAAAVQVVQDLRDALEVCSSQLVSGNDSVDGVSRK